MSAGYDPRDSHSRLKGWDTVSWPVEPPPAEPEGIVVVETRLMED